MRFRHIRRGGEYFRVADPDWDNPLDGSYAAGRGGRWNPPGSFPVVYLSCNHPTARANADRKLAGQPITWDDLLPERRPVLVAVQLPLDRYVDVVTDEGCRAAGLPTSYPLDPTGAVIPRAVCQPIGTEAHAQGESGIACRSAALGAVRGGEELAWFQRSTRLAASGSPEPFERWYWQRPWERLMPSRGRRACRRGSGGRAN